MSEIKKYYFKRGKANETKTNWDSDIDAGRDIGCVEYWSGCDFDVIQDMLRHAETSDQPTGRDKQTTNRTNGNIR